MLWRYDVPTLVRIAMCCLIACLFVVTAANYVIYRAVDWSNAYRPAAQAMLAGRSPYDGGRYCNPPWILLPLLPFVPLPTEIAAPLLTLIVIAVLTYVMVRLDANPIMVVLVLSAPATLHLYRNINIDWLIPLALFMPAYMGLFVAVAKPQVGIGLAIYWFLAGFREGGIPLIFRRFAPVTLALLISFAIYGPWPLQSTDNAVGIGSKWDLNIWPYGLPVALVMITLSLRRRAPNIALAASPLLSPYVAAYTWAMPLVALSRYPWSVLLVFLMWRLFIRADVPFF